MKTLLFACFLILPFWSVSQNDCDVMVRNADDFLAAGNLSEALTEYISALNCNSRLGKDLAPQIQKVFDDIKRQKNHLAILNDKNQKLLSFFFTDKTSEAAWAQGENGKYAVINRDADILGEGFVWEEPQRFNNGTAIAKRGGEYYFVNDSGKVVSDEGFDFIHHTNTPHIFGVQFTKGFPLESVLDSHDGKKKNRIRMLRWGFDKASEDFFPFNQGKKWGLMNADGNEIVEPRYEEVSKVYDGYARVKSGNKWGFIDTEGTIVTQWGGIGYDMVGNFADSIVWTKKGDYYGLIVLSGNPPNQSDIFPQDQDMEKEKRKSLLGVYDAYFSRHIYDQRLHSDPNPNDSITQRIKVDDNLRPIPSSDELSIFEEKGEAENIALYQRNDQFFIVDMAGDTSNSFDNLIRQKKWVYTTNKRSQEGLLVYGSYMGVSRSAGNELSKVVMIRELSNDYEKIGTYQPEQDYIRVKQNGKWGYVFWEIGSKKVSRTIPCKYDLATDFFEKNGEVVARVYIEKFDLYFYINKQGEMLGEIERNKIW